MLSEAGIARKWFSWPMCTFSDTHPPCPPLSLTLCLFSFVLLQFFMLILLIFLAELAAAILAFIFREHVSIRVTVDHHCQRTEYQSTKSWHLQPAQILFFCYFFTRYFLFYVSQGSNRCLKSFLGNTLGNHIICYLIALHWLSQVI